MKFFKGRFGNESPLCHFAGMMNLRPRYFWLMPALGVWLAAAYVTNAQGPKRLRVETGYSPAVSASSVHDGGYICLVDQTVICKDEVLGWWPLPDLYRCGTPSVVKINDDSISAVAQRRTTADTSWWLFRSSSSVWTDSTRLQAEGQFLCSTPGYLLFTTSLPGEPLFVDVYDTAGAFLSSIALTKARSSPATSLRLCGDSIIVLDRSSGRTVCEVIRTGAGKPPSAWAVAVHDEVLSATVGYADAFVYQTAKGVFVDHGGRVRPVRAFTDRIEELAVYGLSAGRIANGAVDAAADITKDSATSTGTQKSMLLTPASHRIIANKGYGFIIASRTGGDIQFLRRGSIDSSSWEFRASNRQSVSRGTKRILSGSTVTIANIFWSINWGVLPAIARVMPYHDECRVQDYETRKLPHEELRRVGLETWLTHGNGMSTYGLPSRWLSKRPGYGAVQGSGTFYIQTSRGIEAMGVSDTTFRLVIPDVFGVGLAAIGDTLLVVRIQTIMTPEPEGQVVVDAYAPDGSPYFFDRIITSELLARGFSFKSVSRADGAVIINLGRRLFTSMDAGVTWAEVDAGIEFLTSIDDAAERPVAWVRQPDGRSGPALMLQPDRWDVQPVELRTISPVIACAHMPGWFVFSTADGVWTLQQTISSVSPGNGTVESEFLDGVPDQEMLVDVLGRTFNRDTAPAGSYFHAVRFGPHWRIRSTVIIP